MKKVTPQRIWVCNRKDGTTTFGIYINAKRRVVAEAKTIEDFEKLVLRDEFVFCMPTKGGATIRPIEWEGDPLPVGWRSLVNEFGQHYKNF